MMTISHLAVSGLAAAIFLGAADPIVGFFA
jgi:hypothetical protein